MRYFVPEICCVECGSREQVVKKFDVFRPKFVDGPQKFWGAFVNWHHFRPTGQVWLRCHGWSFIYADKIKKSVNPCYTLPHQISGRLVDTVAHVGWKTVFFWLNLIFKSGCSCTPITQLVLHLVSKSRSAVYAYMPNFIRICIFCRPWKGKWYTVFSTS